MGKYMGGLIVQNQVLKVVQKIIGNGPGIPRPKIQLLIQGKRQLRNSGKPRLCR